MPRTLLTPERRAQLVATGVYAGQAIMKSLDAIDHSLTAVEWANMAKEYLSAERATMVRAWISEELQADLAEVTKQQKVLEEQLKTLAGASESPQPSVKLDDLNSAMATQTLLRELISRAPGLTSGDYIQMLRDIKGNVGAADIHSRLYKLARAGDIKKSDEKPVRYYPTNAVFEPGGEPI